MSKYRYLIATSLFLSACNAGSEECRSVPEKSQAIKFGADAQMLEVEALRPYLFALRSLVDDEVVHLCTCARIARGVALTARHCVLDANIDDLQLSQSDLMRQEDNCASDESQLEAVSLSQVIQHPDLDAALLFFHDASFGDTDDVVSVKMGAELPTMGSEVVLVGYGLNEAGQIGQLAAIAGQLLDASDLLTVQADQGGACVGDSGGPLLEMGNDSKEPSILGVLSRGSASCLGKDFYVPMTSLDAWIAEELQRTE